jgi:hypothetical protein
MERRDDATRRQVWGGSHSLDCNYFEFAPVVVVLA